MASMGNGSAVRDCGPVDVAGVWQGRVEAIARGGQVGDLVSLAQPHFHPHLVDPLVFGDLPLAPFGSASAQHKPFFQNRIASVCHVRASCVTCRLRHAN